MIRRKSRGCVQPTEVLYL